MNVDVIPDLVMQGRDDPHRRRAAAPGPPTVGQLAMRLHALAERSADWWPLIRFDPDRPIRIRLDRVAVHDEAVAVDGAATVAADAGTGLWLTTWPPGHRAALRREGRGPEVGMLVAGELVEVTIAADGVTERPLRAGRVQVRCPRPDGPAGLSRELHNPGATHAVTLHAARG